MTTIEEAIDRLKADPADERAWELLFSTMWPYELALAYREMRGALSPSDAEDLAQEVFVRLGRAWHSRQIDVTGSEHLRALLAVLTRHLALDRIRRQHRYKRDRRTEIPITAAPDVPDGTADSASQAVWRDLVTKVSKLLADDERLVLEMRLQGYEIPEIAQRMAISARTVDRKLARIKGVLKYDLDIGP